MPFQRYIGWSVLILLLAAGLRFIGISFGQPNPEALPALYPYSHEQAVVHPDEYFYVAIPLEMLALQRGDPYFFENPNLLINFNYLLNRVLQLPIPETSRDDLTVRNYAPHSFYVFTRILSALGGIVTVAGVIGIGRFHSQRAGLIAGLIATLSFTLVQHSHYATTSTLASAGVVVCLWACLCALNHRNSIKFLAIASMASAFAAGNRYNAAAVSISVFIVGLILFWRKRNVVQAVKIVGAWSLFPVLFLLTSPYIILHFSLFWEQFTFIYGRYSQAALAETLHGFYLEHLYVVLLGIGLPATIAVIIGIVQLAQKQARILLTLLAYLVPYTFVVLDTAVPQLSDQLTVVVIPIYCIFVGVGIAYVMDNWLIVGRILAIASIAWLIIPLVSVMSIFTMQDTRLVAQSWLFDNVPQESIIWQIYSYNVPLDPQRYNVRIFYGLEIDADAEEPDYLIVSDAVIFEISRRTGQSAIDLLYQALAPYDNPTLIYEVERTRWIFDTLVNNNAAYWHHPHIRVYCLNADVCALDNP